MKMGRTSLFMLLLFAAVFALHAQAGASEDNLVYVEGGTFQMGGTRFDWEKPIHAVTVKGFYMAKYPVTQKEWVALMGHNPSQFRGDNFPVETVSWYDVVEFCNRLSDIEKLQRVYTFNGTPHRSGNRISDVIVPAGQQPVLMDITKNGYRLPTEAEWEYAAKGGNRPQNTVYSGSNNWDEVAWLNGTVKSTQDVGGKRPNNLGLYDMNGNVWEWCWDWYGSTYYSVSPSSDPQGPSWGNFRVRRSGCWNSRAQNISTTSRAFTQPGSPVNILGFRLVRSAP